ncbi:MAG: DUF2975 domain-containing protein [Ruminococcaceae bacterium]|nr:DUF2975 domain-containing protein [Oscillospiraceae bacterium]
MLKIPSKLSILLSLVISVTFFIVCIGGAFFMPPLVENLINAREYIGNNLDFTINQAFTLTLAYIILAVAMLADVLLFFLLLRVRANKIFTYQSVSLIRGVSWCCFLISAVFGILGIYFYISFIVFFVGVFLGLCLRIVKNVIEEATQIKEENDFTV